MKGSSQRGVQVHLKEWTLDAYFKAAQERLEMIALQAVDGVEPNGTLNLFADIPETVAFPWFENAKQIAIMLVNRLDELKKKYAVLETKYHISVSISRRGSRYIVGLTFNPYDEKERLGTFSFSPDDN